MTTTGKTPGTDEDHGLGTTASHASSIEARAIRHVFDNGHEALQTTNLVIEEGSFSTLLGPSGSGKTTLLRIFAGLITPTSGRVLIAGDDVTDKPVQKRGIGFVFQHYALFPHMTVAQNIDYPLRIRGMSKQVRAHQVADILDLIGLGGLGDRRPDQLSGGQQQRVAVGRALVYEPRVLLLDEPLGALDRRLRQQLGADLRRIQRETGTTAVYVTHDQEEAFLLSDEVVVMDHGVVKQQGRPDHVYARPTDLFVAEFLGDTNVLTGRVLGMAGEVVNLDVDGRQVACRAVTEVAVGEMATCTIRPEDVAIAPSLSQQFVLGTGDVIDRMFLGNHVRIIVRIGERTLVADAMDATTPVREGDSVEVGWTEATPFLISGGASLAS